MLNIKKYIFSFLIFVLYIFITNSCTHDNSNDEYYKDGIKISLTTDSNKKIYSKSKNNLIEFDVIIHNETGDSVYIDLFNPIDVSLLVKGFWGCYKNYDYSGLILPSVINYEDVNTEQLYRDRVPKFQKMIDKEITKNHVSQFYDLSDFFYLRMFLETNYKAHYKLKLNPIAMEIGRYLIQVEYPYTIGKDPTKYYYDLANQNNIDLSPKEMGFKKWDGRAKSNSIEFEIIE